MEVHGHAIHQLVRVSRELGQHGVCRHPLRPVHRGLHSFTSQLNLSRV
jgi:hypothetical protein